MTAVKTAKPFLNIEQAAQFMQDLGFESCTTETIKYLAYETDKLPRPKIVGRRSYWARIDLEKLVNKL